MGLVLWSRGFAWSLGLCFRSFWYGVGFLLLWIFRYSDMNDAFDFSLEAFQWAIERKTLIETSSDIVNKQQSQWLAS